MQTAQPQLEIHKRDLTCRQLSLRASSVNQEDRTFEAVVASEKPAQVFDMRSYDVIDEILVARGGQFPSQVPLLDNHDRYSGVGAVVGSAENFRMEAGQWVGMGRISRAVEGNIDRAQLWQDIVDGHIRAVSIGYQVQDYTDIPAGKRQVVAGRSYEANQRTLRVTTSWVVRELSLTPIGADDNAMIRTDPAAAPPQRRSIFR